MMAAAFIAGAVIGGTLGAIISALCFSNSQIDDEHKQDTEGLL